MNFTKIITTFLFVAFASHAVSNPTVTDCCPCFKITVMGMTDGTFKKDKNGDFTAHVKVEKVAAPNCPTGTFKVSVSAALYDEYTFIDAKAHIVELSGAPVLVKFTLTADEARLGDNWVFDSSCVETTVDDNEETVGEKEDKVELPGCKHQSFPLEGCAACSEGCAYTGETTASNGSTSKHGATGSGGFSAQIPTTRSVGGDAEGTLSFLTDDFANPGRAALYAAVPSDFTVNRSGGLVTSIQTGSATIEVAPADSALLALDPNAFTITHKDSIGTVFRTTTISFVTEGGVQRLRMDSTFDGTTIRREQTRPQPGTLILEEGRVVAGTFEPLSRDSLVRTEPSPGKRVERRTISQRPAATAPWAVTSDNETTEEQQISGWVTTKEVTDPTGAALTSTWAYYQPGEVTGPGGSYEGLGRLKQYTGYDGSTSFHTYTLNQTSVTSPYAGNPAGKVTKSTWNPGTLTSTDTTEINGIMVSKSVTIHTPTTEQNITYTSSTGTLTTVTHYLPSGQDFGGNPSKTLHPDGTLTTYAYTRNPGGGSTTVSENGSTTDNNTVAKGTRSITTTNSRGTTILSKTEAVGYGTGNAIFSSMAVTSIDNLGRPLATAHHPASLSVTGEVAIATGAAYTTTTEYSCCGTAKEVDMYGIPTFYAYDHLQRQIKTNRLGVTTETHYKGLTTEEHRYAETVSGSLSSALAGSAATLVSRSVSNLSATLQESWSPNPTSATPGALVKSSSTATTYKPAIGLSMRSVTTTPDSFTQTTDSFLDGRIAATYGDLRPAMQYAYSADATGEINSQSYVDGVNLRETTTTQSDWARRTVRMDYMGGASSSMHYNSKGQMEKSIDPDGVVTLYEYNTRGEHTLTAIDLNRSGAPDYGSDTVQSSETVPSTGTIEGVTGTVWETTSKVWHKDSNNQVIESTDSTSLRSADGLRASSQSIGIAEPSTSVTNLSGDGNWTTTQTNPDDTKSVQTYTAGLLASSSSLDNSASNIQNLTFSYDPLNRPLSETDSRTGTTTTEYRSLTSDVVKSVTDSGSRITSFTYDVRGRRTVTTLPDNTTTTTAYNADGTVAESSGSQTYRTTHTYDYAQRMVSLTTYGTETATTNWIYSPDRGFLVEKNHSGETDNGIADVDYGYTDAGRLETRTWERGVVTTYGHDNNGRVATVTYTNESNGHTTPNLVYEYDALGRPKTVTRGGVPHASYTYRPGDLTLLTETQQIETLNQTVTRTYEDGTGGTLGGRANGYTFANGTSTWTYDNAGRLSTVRSGDTPVPIFTYGYETNSYGLVKTLTGPQVVTTNTYEATRDVLQSKQNDITGGTLSRFAYTVNSIGQRIGMSPSGSAFATTTPFTWDYNARGELTSAARPGSPTFERAYTYDGIGNRLSGGDPVTPTTYTPNALNQYSSVNHQSTIINPQFDPDGNMTSGPVPGANGLNPGISPPANATLTWDAENRLVKAVVSTITVDYAYDHQSRLISQTIGTTTTRYLYDGWNRIAEYEDNGSGHPLKSTYLWGMDLSGSMQGAGGVGGLLMVSQITNNSITSNHFPTYDGNGNISEYVDGNGAEAAHYEYDPFGRATVATGPKANNFAHRFSTKPMDATTGLYYYGYRWYDLLTGRWPSRDPIEEEGGLNLYGFNGNNPISSVDFIGLKEFYSYIIGGHGWHTVLPRGTVETLMTSYVNEKKFDKERDRVSAVSCFNGDINRRFPRSISSVNDQFNDANIVDYTDFTNSNGKKQRLWNPEEPGFLWFRGPRRLTGVNPSGVDNKHWAFDGPWEAYLLAEQKIIDAETQAEADLVQFMQDDPKMSACSITVKFVCESYKDIGLDVIDFNSSKVYPPGSRSVCGHSNTYRYNKNKKVGVWAKPKFVRWQPK